MSLCARFILTLFSVLGAAWSQWVPTQGPSSEDVVSIVSVGGVFYAGVNGSPVFRSKDDGKSWKSVASSLQIYSDPTVYRGITLAASGSMVYAGPIVGNVGWITNDAEEWKSVDTSMVGTVIQVVAAARGTLLVGKNGRGAYRSLDSDSGWSLLTLPDRFETFAALGNRMIAGHPQGGFHVSNDGGQSWTFDSTSTQDQYGVWSFLSLDASGTSFLAGSGNGRVFYSPDSGKTWSRSFIDTGWKYVTAVGMDDSIFLAGTAHDGLYRSVNHGANWLPVLGFPRREIFSINRSGSTWLVGTKQGGIFRSIDEGATWTLANKGLRTARMMSLATLGDALIAGTSAGIHKTTDGGKSWELHGETLSNIKSVAVSGQQVFAATSDGVYRSRDTGLTWTSALPPPPTPDPDLIRALVRLDSNLYAGGTRAFRSGDGGDTWAPISAIFIQGKAMYRGISGFAKIGTTLFTIIESALFSSEDEGNSWQKLGGHVGVVELYSMGDALFISKGDGSYRSRDKGVNWSRIGSDLGPEPIIGFYAHAGQLLGISPAGAAIVSSDEGDTWIPVAKGLEGFNVRALLAQGSYLYAGTEYDGVWRMPWSEVPVSSGTSRPPTLPGFELPPTLILRGTQTIRFTLSHPARVVLRLFDVRGKEVIWILRQRLGPGRHQIALGGQALHEGIYLLDLRANDHGATYRVLVER